MNTVFTIPILLCACCLSLCAQLLPPGLVAPVQSPRGAEQRVGTMSLVVPPAPHTSPITLVIEAYTPQVSILKFYHTNHVTRYQLERSEDLKYWRTVEGYTGTNDYSPTVPMLRDNQRLVTHLLVRPGLAQQFYRLTILP